MKLDARQVKTVRDLMLLLKPLRTPKDIFDAICLIRFANDTAWNCEAILIYIAWCVEREKEREIVLLLHDLRLIALRLRWLCGKVLQSIDGPQEVIASLDLMAKDLAELRDVGEVFLAQRNKQYIQRFLSLLDGKTEHRRNVYNA